MAQSRISRVTGYEPLQISRRVKRGLASAFLSVPLGLISTAISDSTALSNTFRYVFSPGTMLALRFVRVEASHRGFGAFLDAMNAYATMMDAALALNAIFYGLLLFGIMTIVSTTWAGSSVG